MGIWKEAKRGRERRIQWHNRNTHFSIQKSRAQHKIIYGFPHVVCGLCVHNMTLFRITYNCRRRRSKQLPERHKNAICHRWPNEKHDSLPRHCVNRSVLEHETNKNKQQKIVFILAGTWCVHCPLAPVPPFLKPQSGHNSARKAGQAPYMNRCACVFEPPSSPPQYTGGGTDADRTIWEFDPLG